MNKPVVFISYSHKDEGWMVRLKTHLGVLQRHGDLEIWTDDDISAGDDWYEKIKDAMDRATIGILLITSNSLTSEFILGKEVSRLLERRARDGLRIFPIIVEPCAWHHVDWLTQMQIRPKSGTPLSAGTEHQVNEALTLIVSEISVLLNSAELPSPAAHIQADQAVQDYCNRLVLQFSVITALGDRVKYHTESRENAHECQSVKSAFIPLHLSEVWRDDRLGKGGGWEIEDLFFGNTGGRRFLLRGLPGSGKTTLLHYLTYRFAEARIQQQAGPVPIYVRLRELDLSKMSLRELLRQALDEACLNPHDAKVIFNNGRFLEENTVLLLDGLDEIAGADGKRSVASILDEFADSHRYFRIIVTSRPVGLQPSDFRRYKLFDIEPLSQDLRDAYVEAWFAGERAAVTRIKGILSANSRINSLTTSPFLLSLICSAFEVVGETSLIRNRSALYKSCTEYLIKRLYDKEDARSSNIDYESTLVMLKDLAWRFFLWQEPDFPQDYVSVIGAHVLPPEFTDSIEEVLERVQKFTGLIQRYGSSYTFVHKSLWEYFTALALLDKRRDSVIRHATNPDWEEVIRLYAGLLVANGNGVSGLIRDLWVVNKPLTVRVCSETEQTAELVRGVISKEKSKGKTEKLLLIDSLEQSLNLMPKNERGAIVDETLRVLLIGCEERDCEVIFHAQELLERLGMNPLESGGIIYEVLDLENAATRQQGFLADPQSHLEWIDVQGGEFWMGEDNYMFNESPARLVKVNDFRISKHPVTNHIAAKFTFIEITLAHADPSYPVVGLTWYEATYLALWLACRLPREDEWEYAARGGKNAQRMPYFFGSDPKQLTYYAWFNEPTRDHPHAVDELNPLTARENLNPLGVANILGNVWEWCEDVYSNYDPPDSSTSVADYHRGEMMSGEKVLRGGTFRGSENNVRCGRRVFSHPSNRGSVVGFRLVCDKAEA